MPKMCRCIASTARQRNHLSASFCITTRRPIMLSTTQSQQADHVAVVVPSELRGRQRKTKMSGECRIPLAPQQNRPFNSIPSWKYATRYASRMAMQR